MIDTQKVNEHYSRSGLTGRLRAALADAGLEHGTLRPEQLAPFDQFHSRGLAATIDMAHALQLSREDRVIDVGSGIGGPSRFLAATYGCRVSGIDLSPLYVEAATFLAMRCGLTGKVDYQCADALKMPFESEQFNVAWTQHVAMNIADRAGLYKEIHRVLKPGGRLAIYDVVAGNGDDLVFPVPWSANAETSFLLTPEVMRSTLGAQGFTVTSWIDRTPAAVAWFADMNKRPASVEGTQLPGLQLVMGDEFRTMTINLAGNLAQGRVQVIEAVLTRR